MRPTFRSRPLIATAAACLLAATVTAPVHAQPTASAPVQPFLSRQLDLFCLPVRDVRGLSLKMPS